LIHVGRSSFRMLNLRDFENWNSRLLTYPKMVGLGSVRVLPSRSPHSLRTFYADHRVDVRRSMLSNSDSARVSAVRAARMPHSRGTVPPVTPQAPLRFVLYRDRISARLFLLMRSDRCDRCEAIDVDRKRAHRDNRVKTARAHAFRKSTLDQNEKTP
jgi:hypothetical protein